MNYLLNSIRSSILEVLGNPRSSNTCYMAQDLLEVVDGVSEEIRRDVIRFALFRSRLGNIPTSFYIMEKEYAVPLKSAERVLRMWNDEIRKISILALREEDILEYFVEAVEELLFSEGLGIEDRISIFANALNLNMQDALRKMNCAS